MFWVILQALRNSLASHRFCLSEKIMFLAIMDMYMAKHIFYFSNHWKDISKH